MLNLVTIFDGAAEADCSGMVSPDAKLRWSSRSILLGQHWRRPEAWIERRYADGHTNKQEGSKETHILTFAERLNIKLVRAHEATVKVDATMITSPSCCSLAIGEWAESKLSRLTMATIPRPQPVQADDGSTGYDDVFYHEEKKHEIPAIDFGSAGRTRWQPVLDCVRRLGRAEGGRCRRDNEMGQDFGTHDPDKVVLLYAPDGVLGELSLLPASGSSALRDYFVTAFKVLPNLKVTFGEQLIRVYGRTAVNTGYYTFSYIKDGETKTLPARL